MSSPRLSIILGSLLLAIGLAVAGHFIGQGIAGRNVGPRIISVKGLSEREVPASIAIWQIAFMATANDLNDINRKLGMSTNAVLGYLKSAGFDDKDMSVQPPSVVDTTTEPRVKDVPPPIERYRANQSVLLRTSKVDAIKPAMASASTLITNGVLISSRTQPEYVFNQLNDIKPDMIQEATRNARIAADQFSRDSQTKLGKLRNASQGWFQVEDRDAATPERKMIRVVVDVEYEIE
jgi:hypothetical protein